MPGREVEGREVEGSNSNSEKSDQLSVGSRDLKKAMKSAIDSSIGDILCTTHRDARRELEAMERTISGKGSTDLYDENNKNGNSNSVFLRNKNGDDGIYAINGKFGPTSRVLISSIKSLNLNSNLNSGVTSLDDAVESGSGSGSGKGGLEGEGGVLYRIQDSADLQNNNINNSSNNNNGNSNISGKSRSNRALDERESTDPKKGTTTASSSTSTLTSTSLSTSLSTNPPKSAPHSSPPATFEREALALQLELAQMQKALQDRMHRYQVLTSFNPDKMQK